MCFSIAYFSECSSHLPLLLCSVPGRRRRREGTFHCVSRAARKKKYIVHLSLVCERDLLPPPRSFVRSFVRSLLFCFVPSSHHTHDHSSSSFSSPSVTSAAAVRLLYFSYRKCARYRHTESITNSSFLNNNKEPRNDYWKKQNKIAQKKSTFEIQLSIRHATARLFFFEWRYAASTADDDANTLPQFANVL